MEMGYLEMTHPVLDDGFVRLESYMGGDLSVVNHARKTLDKYHEEIEERDEGLIRRLMRNGHGSPFESIHFSFHIRAPIFVARQWMRHRIASYNEISGRWADTEKKFYVPKGELLRKETSNHIFEEMDDSEGIEATLLNSFDLCVRTYNYFLNRGMAKELARIVLPTAMYTEFYFDVNGRSLMNFLAQRNHKHAQMEIRKYAEKIEKVFALVAPLCYNAFQKYGRRAP